VGAVHQLDSVLIMANPFCLLPKYADQFLEKVKSGELNAAALSKMTSEERHAAFASFMGETNAAHVNASFESKLLLKNQQAGITKWIESAKNLTPAAKRDLLSRVERMDAKVLTPKNADAFLSDLAKQRLGFGVTMEEAAHITALAKEASDAKAAMLAGGDRMAYGRAKVEFGKYVSELKNNIKQPTTVGKAISNTASFAKAFKAAFDNSALLRQGWKTLFTHPDVWAKNAVQSFKDLAQQFGGKEVMDEVNAEIGSRPNALNGRYDKAKLALANVEEMFPTTLPEKIPLVGRAYKASEAAFTAFQYRMRADVFDKYMEIGERSGVDLSDRAQLESIGRLVNSLTARGHLGPVEPAANTLNVLMFSARKLKSDFDLLTAHQLDAGVTPFVRKQAAVNLVKVVSGTAGLLAIAHAVNPGSVDFDPRSANFGKIRVGNTRFDVTGGIGSIPILAARLVMRSTKSSTTDKISPINSGKFGSQTGTDLVYNFFEGKLSPAASVVKDILKGEDFQHNKLHLTPKSLAQEGSNLFMPLPISNAQELLSDPATAPATAAIAVIADALGMSTNTYSNAKPKRK
jgi:hypothetical protein